MATIQELQYLKALPLELKVAKSMQRIREWYYHFSGDVYISFSGGKDSTVLLDLVRSEFPDVPAVFINTGLEYPEILDFIKTIDNVVWLKPKFDFKTVTEKYGYPIISKEQAQFIDQYRTAKSEKTKNTRLNGDSKGRFKISEKWKPFLDTEFKVSDRCCNIMKKNPIKIYEKETGRVGFVGTMTSESIGRQQVWLKNGCNSFDSKRQISKPMSFWEEENVWEYIRYKNLSYATIYDKGLERTGCMHCLFGIHLEKDPNRLQTLKTVHPKIYDYILNNLGAKEMIEFMNENCKCNIKL